MPAGPRVRANNVYGTVSDNPLLAAGVSFTSLGLSLLPAISGQHAVAVLDPKRVFGEPEIVVITAHLAMGTTATITRGQYGTTARDHPQGTAWAHVPIDEDYTEIVTSSTRPTNPYDGQMIYETDTGRWTSRLGSVWIPAPHNVPTCRVFNSVNLSVLNAASTTLTYNSELYDTDTMHSTAVNTDRITINTAGVYLVQAGGTWSTDTDYTRRIVSLILNGVTTISRYSQEYGANITQNEGWYVAAPYKLIVGDILTVSVFQQNTNAGTNTVGDVGFMAPWFAATWIGIG